MGLPMPVPPQHGGLLLGVALQPRTLSPQTGTPASDAAVGEFHVTLTPDQVNWLVSSYWKFQGSFLSPVFWWFMKMAFVWVPSHPLPPAPWLSESGNSRSFPGYFL